MILFFDTETTGKADFHAAPDAPHQPRLVQLAAMLTNDDGNEMATLNVIIKPDGFAIPEQSAAIHGITQSIATDYGICLEAALPAFAQLCSKPQIVTAHNIKFDLLIMQGEFLRAGFDDNPFDGASMFCTMQAMMPICKLPGAYGDFKWPRLQEAHKHAFGTEFEGAHDALADVKACAKIYFWIKNQSKP